MTARDFAADAPRETALVLALDGYDGPIDLLLALAREQKVDLAKISILALADQYLEYIAGMHRLRLEIAADYLVMAAWLAYLKSRLLLPDPPAADDEPTAEELAAALHHRLQLLSAMQRAGAALMTGSLMGRDVFARGAPEEFAPVERPVYELSLYDLLSAYGTTHRRQHAQVLTIMPAEMYSLDDGLRHLAQFIGKVPEWQDLMGFLPEELRDGVFRRSAVAATFSATLELVRAGRIELRQDRPFGPLYLRSAGAHG